MASFRSDGPAVSREEFEALQALVARLSAQVARLAEATPVPEQHLAIMAAVFAQFLGRPVRVRSARRLGGPSSSWSQEGRSSLHSQRHVRRG